MWNKKLFLTKHLMERFENREINFSKKGVSVYQQVKHDLRALNVRKIEKYEDNYTKVTTNQGKVYILAECEKVVYVITVYKSNLQFENDYFKKFRNDNYER